MRSNANGAASKAAPFALCPAEKDLSAAFAGDFALPEADRHGLHGAAGRAAVQALLRAVAKTAADALAPTPPKITEALFHDASWALPPRASRMIVVKRMKYMVKDSKISPAMSSASHRTKAAGAFQISSSPIER